MKRCKETTVSGKRCKNKPCNSLAVCCSHARECSVCLDKTSGGRVKKLSCGHVFHVDCINPWFEKDHRCPYCRAPVKKPLVRLTMNPDISQTRETMESLRRVLTDIYDAGNLPSGPIFIDVSDGHLVIVDIDNDIVMAYVETA